MFEEKAWRIQASGIPTYWRNLSLTCSGNCLLLQNLPSRWCEEFISKRKFCLKDAERWEGHKRLICRRTWMWEKSLTKTSEWHTDRLTELYTYTLYIRQNFIVSDCHIAWLKIRKIYVINGAGRKWKYLMKQLWYVNNIETDNKTWLYYYDVPIKSQNNFWIFESENIVQHVVLVT